MLHKCSPRQGQLITVHYAYMEYLGIDSHGDTQTGLNAHGPECSAPGQHKDVVLLHLQSLFPLVGVFLARSLS